MKYKCFKFQGTQDPTSAYCFSGFYFKLDAKIRDQFMCVEIEPFLKKKLKAIKNYTSKND